MGVWIEMLELANRAMVAVVTPYVGVWIEMKRNPGLNGIRQVTPYVGVWIEGDDNYYLFPLKEGNFNPHPHIGGDLSNFDFWTCNSISIHTPT